MNQFRIFAKTICHFEEPGTRKRFTFAEIAAAALPFCQPRNLRIIVAATPD